MAHLKLITTNLLVDRADPVQLRRVLETEDADVVVVQELGPSGADVLGSIYPHGKLAPKRDCFGQGIVAKQPVQVERLDTPERPAWTANLDPADWAELSVPLDVVGMHMANPIDRPWRATRRARHAQIAGVREFLSDRPHPSVVLGDMNSSPIWPEYTMLCELGEDAAKATDTTAATWAHFLFGPRWIRIDHAFVDGLRPVTTRLVKVEGTDHRALVVEIEAP